MWLRNFSMRMMTRWPVRNLVARLFRKADAIVLQDYAELLSESTQEATGLGSMSSNILVSPPSPPNMVRMSSSIKPR